MVTISKRDYVTRWVVVAFLAPFLLGLAIFSYQSVQKNQRDVDMLKDEDLPLLKDIQELKLALTTAEASVYELYLKDREYIQAFNQKFTRQTQLVDEILSRLENSSVVGNTPAFRALLQENINIQDSTNEFVSIMLAPNSGQKWDDARAKLDDFRPLTDSAIKNSDQLVIQVEDKLKQRSDAYASRVRYTLYLVAFFVALALVASAWMAHSNQVRIRAQREQVRLAAFPRSNPHPVLALDQNGKVIYANEAALALTRDGDPSSLLPDDLYAYLTKSETYNEWEFDKEGRTFHISLGYLKGYEEYHAYMSDITARKKAEEDLAYLAYHDATTGLINRQQFNEFVEEQLTDTESLLVVAIMDMELLDKVVSAAGVSVAEKVARIAAMRLQHTITEERYFETSCLSYVGGGLFCFAYPKDKLEAELILSRMQEVITSPFDVDGYEFFLHLTIGVASGDDIADCTSEEALRRADAALQLAKQKGAGGIEFYEHGVASQQQNRRDIEYALRHAIERDQLEVHYQPKLCLQSNSITSVEALVRWRHPELGNVSPADFIPIAEESGQIIEIGQWVLEQSCEDLERWNTSLKQPVNVAVNLSATQLLHSDVGAQVLNACRRFDVPINWVELEITETAALSDFERALEKLQQLKTLGIQLSLDDFGTGFSSLSYLQQIPVSVLKIDRSFVSSITTGCKDESLTQSILLMAKQLDLKVVAEGVETEEQFGLLKQWGCDYIQGYLIAKPMAFEQLTQFLQSFHNSKTVSNAVNS